jgi:hypothetical protein
VKSLLKRDGPRAPTAIHGPLGLKFFLLEKANAIAGCLENQFTPHDLCDENHEWRVEATVQALLKAVDNNPPERIRPCDLHIKDKGLVNASQFGFCECHSTTLQWMRLTNHVTLNFNNKMSTAAVFLDLEKAFDITWHPGLIYKLSKLEFSTNFN